MCMYQAQAIVTVLVGLGFAEGTSFMRGGLKRQAHIVKKRAKNRTRAFRC